MKRGLIGIMIFITLFKDSNGTSVTYEQLEPTTNIKNMENIQARQTNNKVPKILIDIFEKQEINNKQNQASADPLDIDSEYQSQKSSNSSSSSDDPITSFIFGILFFIIGFPVLWFNERRYVIEQYRIRHAFTSCIVVNCNQFDPSFEQQLVFTSGRAQTNDIVCDQQFGVVQANAIKVERRVEMYQWVETSRSQNKKTLYEYSLQWKDSFVDSSIFNQPYGHENDQSKWIVTKQTFVAPNVYLGQYLLSDSLKIQTSKLEPVLVNQSNCEIIKQQLQFQCHPIMFIYFQIVNSIQEGNSIMFKQYYNQSYPGDLKVHFERVPCEDLSIVSEQVDNTFQVWVIHDKYEEDQNLDQLQDEGCCKQTCSFIKKMEAPLSSIDWVFESILTKGQAFSIKLKASTLKTTYIRFCGWLLMVFGLMIFFSPISTIISFFPFFGNFLAAVTTFVFGIICFVIGTVTALLTIAIAWLRFRPMVALDFIVVSWALGCGIYFWAKQQQ